MAKQKPTAKPDFHALVDQIYVGVLVLDENWQVIYLNKRAEAMMGKARDFLGKNLWTVYPEAQGKAFYKAYHEVMENKTSRVIEEYSSALDRWIQASIYPFSKGLSIYFHDISGQRDAEFKAAESETSYRQFIERITDGFIALDNEFRYTYANKRIGEITNIDPLTLVGRNVWEVFPEAVGSDTYKAFHTSLKEQRFVSHIDYYEPLNLWQENYIYPSPDGLSIFIKDISDRKRLELDLKEQERNQQFEIMITSLEAQERERTHIARELHDNVNQLLVSSRLMLALLRDAPHQMEALLPKSIRNIEMAIEENRRISHELVTPDLKQEPLLEQLRFLIEGMFLPLGIRVKMHLPLFDETLLDEQRKLAVYRITQEHCTNIIKHAGATRVDLTLTTNKGVFTMAISDNGKGMNADKVVDGIGIRNIRGRIGFFDGRVDVKTVKGKGFKLLISIPIASKKFIQEIGSLE